jgi:hypothetical protein
MATDRFIMIFILVLDQYTTLQPTECFPIAALRSDNIPPLAVVSVQIHICSESHIVEHEEKTASCSRVADMKIMIHVF